MVTGLETFMSKKRMYTYIYTHRHIHTQQQRKQITNLPNSNVFFYYDILFGGDIRFFLRVSNSNFVYPSISIRRLTGR